jgi:hypothetical protein
MNHNQNMAKLYFFLGLLACLTSISIAVMLYSSFGYSLIERILYGIVGFIIAVSSISLLTASGALGQKGNFFLSFMCFAGWLIAVVFAVFAEIGFMAHAIQNTSNNSDHAVATKEKMADLDQQIESNSGILSLDITGLKNQIAVKNSELNDARTALANCPSGWRKNCINPAQNRINAIQSDLTALQSQMREYEKLQGLKTLKSDLATQTSGSIQDMSQVKTDLLFVLIGEFFSVSAQKAMAYFLLATAVFFEILSSLLFLISRRFDEPDNYAMAGNHATQFVNEPPPQLATPPITAALPATQAWSYPQLSDFAKKG